MQPNICVLQGISLLQEHLTSFSQSYCARGCTWEGLLETEFWIHLPMTIEMLLGPFPMDVSAEYSARTPSEGERGPHFH